MSKIKPFITKGVQNVIPVLELLDATAGVLPPLKSAASGALFIFRTVEEYGRNQKDWKAFADYVTQAVACVSATVSQNRQSWHFESAMMDLEKALLEIVSIIRAVPELNAEVKWYNKFGQYYSFLKDRKKIPDLETKLDRALKNFNLGTTIEARNDLVYILSNTTELVAGLQVLTTHVENIEQAQQKFDVDASLRQLRCADHSSFDSQKACYPGTRSDILAELESFASDADPSSPHRILLLTGVAGCGKTAIAQSAAKLFDHSDWTRPRLGACFNFSAQVEDRRTPKLLFSTIAFALSALHPHLKSSVAEALSNRPTLASSASPSDQFHELIELPLRAFFTTFTCPVVMILDALDEVEKSQLGSLLDLLANDFSRLPASCRVVITSRPDHDIISRLEYTARRHVVMRKIELDDPKGLHDIHSVARYRLGEIAQQRGFEPSWPGSELEERLAQKAGGLFIWLDVVCKAVGTHRRPIEELQRLLESDNTVSDMNLLYQRILDACWEREGFEPNYHRVVGTILALKTPLSAVAIQQILGKLLQGRDVESISDPLACGILDVGAPTSLSASEPPLRISHESFRAFATRRDTPMVLDGQKQYLVDETESSQRLALRCLLVLNDQLPHHAALVKRLFPDDDDTDDAEVGNVPSLDDGVVSEVLEYACDHWMAHLSTVVEPEIGLLDALRQFLQGNVAVWMQLCACRGKFQGIDVLQTWLAKSSHNAGIDLATETDRDTLSRCLDQLEGRMRYSRRLEEALAAGQLWAEVERGFKGDNPALPITTLAQVLRRQSLCLAKLGQPEEALFLGRQAVGAYRQLTDEHSSGTNPDLAMSLTDLSERLLALRQLDEALIMAQEAVNMYRLLVAKEPEALAADLSKSLHSLAKCLTSVGRREEALSVDLEAVKIRRQLAAARPAAFNPDLARSLHSLSVDFSDLGRPEEALSADLEAAEIRRQLAATRPTAFNPDLSLSLHNLSADLSDLGRTEEALVAIEEAVDILRQLAAARPATFNSDLADSLHSLSVNLSALRRPEEALDVIHESVDIRRQFAAAQPTAFDSNLAYSLHSLSVYLGELGRSEEALSVVQESVDIRRQLAAARPAAFNSDLADSLHGLSVCLDELGRTDEALSVDDEVVDIRRQLARELPAKFNFDLATTLYNMSINLSKLGHTERALDTIQEALPLYRQLAVDIPARYTSELADALHRLAECLEALGRDDEAAAAREEREALL